LSNKEEFAPIAFWIDALREKTIKECRQATVVKDPSLMAVQVGRLNAFDEIRSVILSSKHNIFSIPEAVVNKPYTNKITELSPGAQAYAEANGIIPMQEDKPVE
jgi:hypothetical protein